MIIHYYPINPFINPDALPILFLSRKLCCDVIFYFLMMILCKIFTGNVIYTYFYFEEVMKTHTNDAYASISVIVLLFSRFPLTSRKDTGKKVYNLRT